MGCTAGGIEINFSQKMMLTRSIKQLIDVSFLDRNVKLREEGSASLTVGMGMKLKFPSNNGSTTNSAISVEFHFA